MSTSQVPPSQQPAQAPLPPGSVPPAIHTMTDNQDERTMAAVAHASILLNLFMPGLGIIAAGAVWLTQREHSRYAGLQALQAAVYQLVLALTPVIIAIVGVFLAFMAAFMGAATNSALPLVMVPLAVFAILAGVLIFLLGLLYGLVGAYETYHGRDFRYWLIGNMVTHG